MPGWIPVGKDPSRIDPGLAEFGAIPFRHFRGAMNHFVTQKAIDPDVKIRVAEFYFKTV